MTLARLQAKFAEVKSNNRAALITYIMAGAPDYATSMTFLENLPGSGADIIELGLPFSDPMADGPTIQKAAQMALNGGIKLHDILQMVENFRQKNDKTPIILMGYYNPIQTYGLEKFCNDAAKSGVDGMLIVDLPLEEEHDLKSAAQNAKLAWIRLVAPTSDDARTLEIAKSASGFIYYVAISGVTGTKSATQQSISSAVAKIKQYSNLPIAVGFGIKTAQDVKSIAQTADAVVVGSRIVQELFAKENVTKALTIVRELAGGLGIRD